jgi:hypothetical protein
LLGQVLEEFKAGSPLVRRCIIVGIFKTACSSIGPSGSVLIDELPNRLSNVHARLQCSGLPEAGEIAKDDLIPNVLIQALIHPEDRGGRALNGGKKLACRECAGRSQVCEQGRTVGVKAVCAYGPSQTLVGLSGR